MRSRRTLPRAPPPILALTRRSRSAPVPASRTCLGPTPSYVNAAASHPVRAWLDALKVGGRLVFPLQAAGSSGAMALITRPESGAGVAGPLADGRGVHPLRRGAGSRDGPQARPGVPTRRPGGRALAALRERAQRDGLGPRRRLGAVDRTGGVGCAARARGTRLDRRRGPGNRDDMRIATGRKSGRFESRADRGYGTCSAVRDCAAHRG